MLIPVVPEVQLPFVLLWRDDGPNARLRALLNATATPPAAAGQHEP